jgi:peptide/nickel transport system substrate-binding protein
MKRNRFLLGAIGVGLLLASTTFSNAQEISIALSAEPSTLDPQAREDGAERAVSDNVYETLMQRLPDGKLVPGLAAELPTQVDATTWEFKLRDGVKFHNGEAFNAASVVASILRVINPDFNSEQLAYFGPIAGAEAIDDLTVHIKTSAPDPMLPSRMYWMKMLPASYVANPAVAEAPVGTGPYKFVNWQRGSEIQLEANAGYWGDEVCVQNATIRFVGEPGTRLSGLLAGELDLIVNLLPEFVSSVPKAVAVEGLETPVIILATDTGVTAIPEVRKALNLAIDREAIAKGIFGGYAAPAQGQLVNPAAFGFNKDLPFYSYDPEAAKKLVENAGATGKTITLLGQSGRWLKDREMLEAVAAYWGETGLKVNVEINEWGQFLSLLFAKDVRPDSVLVVNSNELLDASRETTFAYKAGSGAASNSDQELAAWIDEAGAEIDLEKRAALYTKITAYANERDYLVPLVNIKDIYGLSERLDWQPRRDAKLMIREMKLPGC